jgi:hypothetical protein
MSDLFGAIGIGALVLLVVCFVVATSGRKR